MVKFEYIKDNTSKYENIRVRVNGYYDEDSYVSKWPDENNKHIHIYSQQVINIIYEEKISSLLCGGITFIKISLDESYNLATIEEKDSSEISIEKEKDKYIIKCNFQYDYEYWNRNYTIPEIVSYLSKVTSEKQNILFNINDTETTLNGFNFSKEIEFTDRILRDEISEFMIEIREIFKESYEYLERSNKSSVSIQFNVNDSIKTACMQYLIYFTQFLEDIGIDSKAEIKEDVNRILFEVEPNDKTIALKRIKEALAIYISLIDCEELQFYNDYSNVAVMQLQSNIYHLKSQLMLAKTIIDQQRISIELLSSVKVNSEEKDEISLLGGAVKLKEFECKGVTINPAKVLNLLKRK